MKEGLLSKEQSYMYTPFTLLCRFVITPVKYALKQIFNQGSHKEINILYLYILIISGISRKYK